MPPYLDTVKVIFAIKHVYEKSSSIHKSFTDVSVTDAGVDTVEFLEAAEGLTGMFSMSLTHTHANRLSQEAPF